MSVENWDTDWDTNWDTDWDTNLFTFVSKTWMLSKPTFIKLTTTEYVIVNMSSTDICPCWTKMYKKWTNDIPAFVYNMDFHNTDFHETHN